MSTIIKQVEIIERIDQLIRLQATGTVIELAIRLNISKTKLYRTIRLMKSLHAPIVYDFSLESYVYVESVRFKFGFYDNGTHEDTLHSYVS